MATIISFEEARNKKLLREAQEAEMRRLQETFPYILIESLNIAKKPINWKELQQVYRWDDQLITKLQEYAASLPEISVIHPDILGNLLED